ncbi:MAG TPA: heavy metal translocating P-type ATPase, partial [Beutenbergiaceae bacterium]|nr:heavy metal translocating P-type ATPase [Beutenbergiaceae bacterium]
ATHVGGDTTFSHIISLVEQAQETRTPSMRFLQRFAAIYTPAVIALALVVGVLTGDVRMGLTFLVIACPGALVISVPVAIVAGVGNLARRGVLVTSGEGLENLARADSLMLDKTGTLTTGEPHVVETTGDEALGLAASVEVASEHHLARAIVAEAQARGLVRQPVSQVEVVPGEGVSGVVGHERVHVGKTPAGTVPVESVVARVREWENQGLTGVYVTAGRTMVGAVAITDQVREEAAAALVQAREAGVKQVAMLTGDNPRAAHQVASHVGIDEVHAGLLPQDKTRLVAAAQDSGRHVIMVGDGINDAPALAQADVGVAMGGAGTDASQTTADVILMTDRLDHLAHAKRVARKTTWVMR